MIFAVWLVRSHQIAGDLRYWLTYIGYDKRDHSLSHKIYLGYATLFFTVWGFATLALLASFVGGILVALAAGSFGPAAVVSGAQLAQAAAGLLVLALLAWWLYTGYKAGRSSPMTFTEDDAALICQTPVSRPAVALLWMLGDWIRHGPVFWALAVTLAFALQDAALGSAVSVEHTPRYVLAGLRVLSVVVPLQWGLMALAWAWGVLRLERDRIRRWWWLGPAALAVGLLLLLVTSGTGIFGGFFRGTSGVVLAPLVFPVATGYGFSFLGGPGGTAAWFPGLLASLGWGLAGSLALGLAARPLNLGRAAQESTGRAAIEAAALAGNAQAAAEIALRQRLGTGHPPTRLAGRPGGQALAWKSVLSWQRQGGWRLVGPLLVIFLGAVGMLLAPDWGTRAWALLAWMVAVEQFIAEPLVSDLRMWPLFRGLPLAARRVLLGEMALPWAVVLLAGLLALGLSAVLGPSLIGALSGILGAAPALGAPVGVSVGVPIGVPAGLPAWAGLLLPGAALSCGLAAAVDVLRSARSSRLLTGQAPIPGTTGVMIAALCCGLAALAVQFGGGGLFGYLLGALVTVGASWLLLEIAAEQMQGVE